MISQKFSSYLCHLSYRLLMLFFLIFSVGKVRTFLRRTGKFVKKVLNFFHPIYIVRQIILTIFTIIEFWLRIFWTIIYFFLSLIKPLFFKQSKVKTSALLSFCFFSAWQHSGSFLCFCLCT